MTTRIETPTEQSPASESSATVAAAAVAPTRGLLPQGLVLLRRALPPAVGLGVSLLAILVIHRMLGTVTLEAISQAYDQIPDPLLGLAVLFTAVSFAAVAVYDLVAVETVAPGRIPRGLAAAAGAGGYAVSNALGFPLFTQGALRYRIYGDRAGGLADVGRILGASWFALLVSLVTMAAVALMLGPKNLPGLARYHPELDAAAGAAVLALVFGMVIWLGRSERPVRVGRVSFRLPTSRAAMVQIAAGIVDLTAAAATLYVLMPQDAVGNFPAFLLIYVAATVIGIVSHAPGGLGAFEATLIASLGLGGRADVLGSLLAYRVIYTLMPFGVALLWLAGLESWRRRAVFAGPARILEPMVPRLAAGTALFGGAMLLASGATRDLAVRVDMLSDIVPMPFMEGSHFAAALVGVALLVLARGLNRRLARAWKAALILLVLGAGFSLGRGLDWEEATLLLAIAGLLAVTRNSFYRSQSHNPFVVSRRWFAGVAALVLVSAGLGFIDWNHLADADALWWQVSWSGNASSALRLSFALGVGLAAIGLDSAVYRRRHDHRRARFPVPKAVVEAVARSPHAASALALLGDKRFLIGDEGQGFVMYAQSGRSLVALGEPVAPAARVAELAWSFREHADRAGARPVFYGVGPENLPLFLDMGLTALKLGEVARVPLADFSLKGASRHDLRYGQRRAEKEGLTFEILPQARVRAAMHELRAVSDAWLAMKQGGEKRFSLGYFDATYLAHFDIAVMRKGGRIVAFANLWRGAEKHEIAIDLIRYAPDASKVIMDALFANLLLAAKAEGYRWFNLGAAPLSGLVDRRLASRWNRFGAFLYRRGADLYSFDGLRSFKQKFDPVWTPYYLICPGGLQTPKTLIDVATLVSGSPLGLIRR
ncbi:bifunctional lysylphosphatidylglycerol flippase/synthetase MprF [Methylobacterium organophilum]|uniref:bifunctional lysylphosphatidylglycerol flippase/synthetase MprF n=1 Tax=Methylobacterium organophilum TaxID=410 RepID=UPI001F1433AE|nr:bifunctional lysylphosphatidylglycerol flippase/synthetase MprF [Methylobacterium organophilum]UMY18122.1 bifunctional lysylphosphatidylglycerol flippase/synthetase MprF [Methylobacterium organophilum]